MANRNNIQGLRDKAFLQTLYCGEGLSIAEVGKGFGVSYKVMWRIFHKFKIEMRPLHGPRPPALYCIKCGDDVQLVKSNGFLCGKRCAKHQRESFKTRRNAYEKRPYVRKRVGNLNKRYYYTGPINPTGELQWLNQNKTMLRNVRRLLRKTKTVNQQALRFLKKA